MSSVQLLIRCLSYDIVGNSLSAELGDSMTSTVTRLEMDKEELQMELESVKQLLTTAQTQNDKLKKEAEKRVERKVNTVKPLSS